MRLIITTVLFLLIQISFAQESVSSIGLRAGGGSGFAFKYVENHRYGIEGIISYRDNGFQLTGLWLKYEPFRTDRIRNFYFFGGFGAHAGYITDKNQLCVQQDANCMFVEDAHTKVVGGLDGIVGFEYYFYTVPLALSFDYKPYAEFFGEDFFRVDFWNFGLSIRYTF